MEKLPVLASMPVFPMKERALNLDAGKGENK